MRAMGDRRSGSDRPKGVGRARRSRHCDARSRRRRRTKLRFLVCNAMHHLNQILGDHVQEVRMARDLGSVLVMAL
jgi:hypothetical protein